MRKKVQHYKGIKIVPVPLIPRGKGGRIRLALNYLSFALSASLLGPIKCRDTYDVIFVYEPLPITVGLPAISMKKRNPHLSCSGFRTSGRKDFPQPM
jgi:colanic acid biosynthesis glycosyl transferase WcaI